MHRHTYRSCVKHGGGLVERSRQHHRVVGWVPAHRLNLVGVVRQGVDALLRGHVPHLHSLVSGRTRQCAPARSKTYALRARLPHC